jgi:hypothetical protein
MFADSARDPSGKPGPHPETRRVHSPAPAPIDIADAHDHNFCTMTSQIDGLGSSLEKLL